MTRAWLGFGAIGLLSVVACTKEDNASCGAGSRCAICTPACDGKQCGDDACGGSCGECATDQGCSPAGVCLGAGPGDLVGEWVLLNQVHPQDGSITGLLGKAEAELWDYEAKPKDDREAFITDEGERCTWEYGTTYPHSYSGGYWPSGPGKSAGNLTFSVADGLGAIELVAWDIDDGGAIEYGWAYYHDETPPALRDGAAVYPDFFDPAYVVLGKSFTVTAEGGLHVGAQTFTGGQIPNAFVITAPDVEGGTGEISVGGSLLVTWDPPQPEATMEIFVTTLVDYEGLLVSCTVNDDGQATLPADAMEVLGAGYPGDIGVQLRRSVSRRIQTTTVEGNAAYIDLVARHARLGALPSTL